MAETLTDFVCTACGCLCDDLTLTIEGDRITQVEPPCPVAARFFLQEPPAIPANALIDGRPATLDAALARAGEILRAANTPLVMGLEQATVDAQRAAVALADRLGATLDPTDAHGRSRNHAAVQTLGAVTATLGEVAARSDLIIYWNCDPAVTHPRHIERIARHPHTAPGPAPAQRRVIVVSPERNRSTQLADEALTLAPGGDVAALAILRALLDGVELGGSKSDELDGLQVERQTGAPLAQWAYLEQRLKAARYAAIFYNGDQWAPPSDQAGPDPVRQAITELVRDHHRHGRAVALPLGSPGNAAGAAQVLTWQTGFPGAVNFAAGYPRHLPGEANAAALLERGEADAALILGANPLPNLNGEAESRLAVIPTIVFDDHASETALQATVAIFTPRFGIETTGDVFRSDGVALPLRAAISSPRPTLEALLRRLEASVGD